MTARSSDTVGGVTTNASDALYGIRLTRAMPAGRAGEADRHGTYSAALGQFEELLNAAAVASPASRPLPLFYALSQAGRAIAAAGADMPWRLVGHGIQTSSLNVEDVLTVRVKERKQGTPKQPADSKEPDKQAIDERQEEAPADESAEEPAEEAPVEETRWSVDSFRGVAAATETSALNRPVKLGALWASLPEIADVLPTDEWSKPLRVHPDDEVFTKMAVWDRVSATVMGLDATSLDDVMEQLAAYPGAAGLRPITAQGGPMLNAFTPWGYGLRVSWPLTDGTLTGREELLDRVAPLYGQSDERWLRPALGEAELSPLMTWWALLYALSMLARYEPGTWSAALDLNKSRLAAGLIQVLDVAMESVPELVLDALNRAATPADPGPQS